MFASFSPHRFALNNNAATLKFFNFTWVVGHQLDVGHAKVLQYVRTYPKTPFIRL
jgi:hypothetical protein